MQPLTPSIFSPDWSWASVLCKGLNSSWGQEQPKLGAADSSALTWGECPRSPGEATSFALGQRELLEPHTETRKTSFQETFCQKQWGSLRLVVLEIYDEMVLTMLLWSLLGLINHGGLRALFVQGCNSSILSLLGFPGWPDDLTRLPLWEKASQTLKLWNTPCFICWEAVM